MLTATHKTRLFSTLFLYTLIDALNTCSIISGLRIYIYSLKVVCCSDRGLKPFTSWGITAWKIVIYTLYYIY